MIPSRPVQTEDVRFAVDPALAVRLRAARQRVDGVAASGDDQVADAAAELEAVEGLLAEPGATVTFRARSIGFARWTEAVTGAETDVEMLFAAFRAAVQFVDDDGEVHDLDDDDIEQLRSEWSMTEVRRLFAAVQVLNVSSAVIDPKGSTTAN